MSNRLSPWQVFWFIGSPIGLVATLASMDSASALRAPLITLCVLACVGVVAWIVWDHVVPLWRKRLFSAARTLGIREIYANGLSDDRQIQMMRDASGSIRIMAVSARGLLAHRKPELVAALARGVNISVLIGAPNSTFVVDVERVEFVKRAGHITNEIYAVEAFLVEYLTLAGKKAVGAVGQIELGHFSTELRSSLVLCGVNWGWLTLNLPPAKAVHSCTLELEVTPNGLLTSAQDHFEHVWKLARNDNRVKLICPSAAN